MDFLILRPLPPKTRYHFFEGWWGGVGGWVGGRGVKSFCCIGYKQWGRTALVTASGPMVAQPIPDVEASVRILIC